MHVPINVKSPNNISEWQMGFNSAFKGLTEEHRLRLPESSVMRDIFEPKVEEGTEVWMKLLKEEIHYPCSLIIRIIQQTKENGRGRARATWCIQGFGGEACKKENTWKT
jgi:hypothetical protein